MFWFFHLFTHTRTHTHTDTHRHTHTHTHTPYIYIYIYIYMCVCMCMYVRIYNVRLNRTNTSFQAILCLICSSLWMSQNDFWMEWIQEGAKFFPTTWEKYILNSFHPAKQLIRRLEWIKYIYIISKFMSIISKWYKSTES